MELSAPKRLAGETWVFPGVTNSGYRAGCLIDTGVEAIAYEGFAIDTLAITHGHADHFSSAADVRRCGARVVAAREESSLIENPEVNIRGMFSWAKPSDEMVTRLFRGEGCAVDGFVDGWRREGVEAVPLPGHTLGHTGYLTHDGVLFTGDALYVEELWERHPLPYAIDVGLVRSSLELMCKLGPEWVVPGHGPVVPGASLTRQAVHHAGRIDAIEEALLELLGEPRSTEDAIALLCGHLGLVENPAQYWLAVTTVKAFLASLLANSRAEFFVEAHRGYWRAVR